MDKFIRQTNEADLDLLSNQILFSGLDEQEISIFIKHAAPVYLSIEEGQSFSLPNEYMHMICLVLSGSISIFSVNYDGSRSVIKYIPYGESSGIIYSMLEYYNTIFELKAKNNSEIMLINPDKIFVTDQKLCAIQHKIAVNLIAVQKRVLIEISEHLACLSQRSIKDKILKFLQISCEKTHSYELDLPFSREELANYLAVDRASLSRSLSELKKENIISYKKNHIVILDARSFKFQ